MIAIAIVRRAGATAGVVLLLTVLFACNGGSSSRCGEGSDGVPDIVEEGELDTFRIASLGISEFDIRSGPDSGHRTLVQAHFSDFSFYRVILAERLPFSEACYVYTSRQVVMGRCETNIACTLDEQCPEGYSCQDDYCMPAGTPCQEDRDCPGDMLVCDPALEACVSPECTEAGRCPVGYECIEGRPLPLEVEQVTFEGLAGGELVLTPDESTGKLPTEILDGRAFDGERVDIQVTSGGSAGDFPAFSESIETPELPELSGLGGVADPDLASGPSIGINDQREEPLAVRWKAGDGDYMEFKLIPGSGSETRYIKLRCVTFDDGCLEVPAEALIHLSLDQATNFQLKLERHNSVVHSMKTGEVVEAAAMLDASAILEGTVTR